MAIDRTFQAKNARERERLKALVGRLGEADLRRPVSPDWTVADSLVHLAFWDLRAVILMDRFERDGVRPSPADVDVVNEAVRALGQAIPRRAAAALAADAAERVDRRLEALPDRILEGLDAAGQPFSPTRHVHRAEHLDEIERALNPSGGTRRTPPIAPRGGRDRSTASGLRAAARSGTPGPRGRDRSVARSRRKR